MRIRFFGRGLIVAAALGVVGLGGCGGGGSPPTTPSPTPVPPPQPSIIRSDTVEIEENFAYFFPFYAPERGTIEATVEYTHEDADVTVWIAAGDCEPDAFFSGECVRLVGSREGSNPRTVSAGVQPEGTYTLVVWNRGPYTEMVSTRVYITVYQG
ncbi:MAG: hypothetical protein LJF30_21965 [Acidobacteria bacterium]|nr:hypothetical protein [Acidobacteriota bacterium]